MARCYGYVSQLGLFGEPDADRRSDDPPPEPAPPPPRPEKRARAPAQVKVEDEAPREPLPPIPMGRSPLAPPLAPVREHPWYQVRTADPAGFAPCGCCGVGTQAEAVIARSFDGGRSETRQVLRLCGRCREAFPPFAEGCRAAPAVVSWLREAGLIPFEPKRGML